MKKILLSLAIFLCFSFVSFAQESDALPVELNDNKPLLYVRQGCSHCAKVDAFLEKYNLEDQVLRLETYNEPENQKALEEWFKTLNVTDPNQQGVPFLVIKSNTYLVGDVPIIEYLAKENNITIEKSEYSTSTADMIFLGVGGLFLFGVLGYGVYTIFSKKK